MQLAVKQRLQTSFDKACAGQVAGRIGVAVSGGSDSLALLLSAADWARKKGHEIFAATVDHGLRDGSAKEAQAVAGICAAQEIPHDILPWQDGWDGRGNLQDAARQERYRLLGRWSANRKLDCVFLGHTEDDLVETFLLRLGRGAGVDGLSALRDNWTKDDQRFCRPILGLRRAELRSYLTERGQDWIDDPSNDNTDFERIKLRKALPDLENAGLTVEMLARSARNLASAREALAATALAASKEVVSFSHGIIRLHRAAFLSHPEDIRRRLLNAAIRCVASAPYNARGGSVGRALDALAEGKGFSLNGCLLLVRQGAVEIGREYAAVENLSCDMSQSWDANWTVTGDRECGLCLRVLGEVGLAQVGKWKDMNLSRRHAVALPGLWHGADLVASPLDENGKEFKWKAECDEIRYETILLSH